MKAPDQTYQSPANPVKNINYSMLPPDKLPDWLLQKEAAVKINNYSMQAPDAPPQQIYPLQEKEQVLPEMVIQPVSPPAPPIAPSAPVRSPEAPKIHESATAATEMTPVMDEPVAEVLPEDSTAISEPAAFDEAVIQSGSQMPSNGEGITPNASNETIDEQVENVESVMNGPTAKVEESPPVAEFSETVAMAPDVITEPEIIWPEPLHNIVQPEQKAEVQNPVEALRASNTQPVHESVFNTPQPSSRSFADLIVGNSNTAMVVIGGIILFAVLLIVLQAIGVF